LPLLVSSRRMLCRVRSTSAGPQRQGPGHPEPAAVEQGQQGAVAVPVGAVREHWPMMTVTSAGVSGSAGYSSPEATNHEVLKVLIAVMLGGQELPNPGVIQVGALPAR
jgi:hypothetical protein